MASTIINHTTHKPLINYEYQYAGGVTLLDNRVHPNKPIRSRYQNLNALFVNTNNILGSNINYTRRYYFQDCGYISRGRTLRNGGFVNSKIYLKMSQTDSFLNSNFENTDIITFRVKSYYMPTINISGFGPLFYLQDGVTNYSQVLFDRNFYDRGHEFTRSVSTIKNSDYFEIDLKDYKYNLSIYDQIYYDIINNIYEISIASFNRNGVITILDNSEDNLNMTWL